MENRAMLEKLIQVYQCFEDYSEKHFLENYEDLNINEVHALECIGKMELPNVTKITSSLQITKGAVTKISKKLEKNGFIETYRVEGNKKEKYFRLLKKGQEVFERHERLHSQAVEKDKEIFDRFSEDERKVIDRFLDVLKEDFEEKMR